MTEVRELQPPKAISPMVVTELGMVMEVREVQPPKASSPMVVIPSRSVTILRLLLQTLVMQEGFKLLPHVNLVTFEQPSKA